ncbi:MAG: serine hydrolase [Gemmatimonadetes bacterium]|nr:serine hydrolase [Gemmatimonadota bacterium]
MAVLKLGAVVSLLGTIGHPLVAQSARAGRMSLLDRYVEKARLEWRAPAVAVAVVVRDSVVFAKGYGVLEQGKPARADEHTIFAIGSSSKAFTTAALAMLVDEGKLKWDDRAAERLPGWELGDPWVTREITVTDLVTHRVGLDRADRIWGATTFDRKDILRRQRYIRPVASFRSVYGYNNHMFLAAGQVIENVSGLSWDAFVKQRIFEPLGMNRATTSVKPLGSMSNVATPHGWGRDGVVPIPWHDIDNIGPAGSINASAREMGEWLRLQLGKGRHRGRVLVSEASMRAMHSPQTVIPVERWFASLSPVNHQMVPGTHFFMYGMGWFLQNYRGRYLVHHGGSIDGMRALVGMAPEEGIGIVILTNLNPSSIDEAIMFRFFDLQFGGSSRDWSREMLDSTLALRDRALGQERTQEQARITGTQPTLPLGKYAGTYADSAFGELQIREQSGKLTIQFGVPTGELEHWSHDTFRISWNTPLRDRSLITFRIGSDGAARAAVIGGVPELVRRP